MRSAKALPGHRRPAAIQLVSISELPDALGLNEVDNHGDVAVVAMKYDEVVTLTGVHP